MIYEEKLKLLKIVDTEFLQRVERFRSTRNQLLHEKAFFDNGEIRVAEEEAELAIELVRYVSGFKPER
jgi:uncharacterized protein YutE (UPF0331/DUF86 family)